MPFFEIEHNGEFFEVEANSEELALETFTPERRIAPDLDENKTVESDQGFLGGASQSFNQGATFGFSDEIQSVIAAAVASPFVSDKTFSQLMVDARKSLRADQDKFSAENPKTDFALQLAGGLTTGGGAVASAGRQGTKQLVKEGVKLGGVAGTGFSDSENFLSVDTAIDTAIGGGAGGVISVVAPKVIGSVSDTVKRAINKPQINVFNDKGQFTDDALNALEDLHANSQISKGELNKVIQDNLTKQGVLTAEQAKRFNLFNDRGITPTRADITQQADDFVDLQSAAKRSGDVAETIAKQDEQLINVANQGIDNIKPIASNLDEANSSVFSVVDDVVTKMDEKIQAAYDQANQTAQGQPRITFNNLAKGVSDNRGSELSRPVILEIRNALKNKGLVKTAAEIDVNKRGARIGGLDLRKATVKEAEELRQTLNGIFDSVSPQARRVIRSLKNAIDDDVAESVGEDVFKEARQSRIDFAKLVERNSRNKFDKTKGGFLEDVIDNKIPQEKIIPRLLSGRDDDFLKFKNFLTKESGEAGQQAFNDVKAQVLRGALEKATSTAGKREGGQSVFNARLFKNSLNKLKNSKKYNELFNADEQKLIDDIIEIGNLRVPVSGTYLGKGASEIAINSAKKEVLKRIPFIGEKAIDLVDAVSNIRTDKRLLDVTRETQRALNQ